MKAIRIKIFYCPGDQGGGQPLFREGAEFNKQDFACGLDNGTWPTGMQVEIDEPQFVGSLWEIVLSLTGPVTVLCEVGGPRTLGTCHDTPEVMRLLGT